MRSGNPYCLEDWTGTKFKLKDGGKEQDKCTWIHYFDARDFASHHNSRLLTDAVWVAAIERNGDEKLGEWVLDSAVGQKTLALKLDSDPSGTRDDYLNRLNPNREETLIPPAGLRGSRSLRADGKRRLRILRGKNRNKGLNDNEAGWSNRDTIFEGAVNHDVGFRCVVDWFFVDGSGRAFLSTEHVLLNLLPPKSED